MTLRALFWDMDGTLTVPNIDWAELRSRVGVPPGVGIMEHIYSLSEAEAQQADTVVREIEMASVLAAEPNDGLAQLFSRLDETDWKQALITNNHRAAMEHVVERLSLRFDLLLSREDALLKPAPDLLLLALRHFDLQPEQAVFIGDGRYDREAASAAGIRYIHLEHDPAATAEGDVIRHLSQLLPLLEA